MSRLCPQARLDHRDFPDLGEITSERVARLGCQFDEHSAPVVRIGLSREYTFLDHCLQPAQRRRGGNSRSYAQARYRHPELGDLGLQQVEQHVQAGSANRSSRKKRLLNRRARITPLTVSSEISGASALALT